MNDVQFITVTQLKKELNVEKISVVKNPKTGKLFVDAEGQFLKCQNKDFEEKSKHDDYDFRFRHEGVIEEGCLVLVDTTKNNTDNVMATL